MLGAEEYVTRMYCPGFSVMLWFVTAATAIQLTPSMLVSMAETAPDAIVTIVAVRFLFW